MNYRHLSSVFVEFTFRRKRNKISQDFSEKNKNTPFLITTSVWESTDRHILNFSSDNGPVIEHRF